jgi:hypothetical protein
MLLEAIWEDGNWEKWAVLGVVVVGAYLLVMWLAALYWTYRDASSRTRDQVLQGIAVGTVLVFNLPGLLLYLILRPKTTLSERYEHRLEAEALLHEIREQPACPQCRRKIETDFLTCPYCRAALRVGCEECGKALAFGWVSCPYCGADRAQPQPHSARPQAAGDTSVLEPNITPMSKPSRPKRASTATYTPPAPKPAVESTPSTEPVTEP